MDWAGSLFRAWGLSRPLIPAWDMLGVQIDSLLHAKHHPPLAWRLCVCPDVSCGSRAFQLLGILMRIPPFFTLASKFGVCLDCSSEGRTYTKRMHQCISIVQ